ncbi:agamous-like MADS-box protein AGL62 [Solanum tuberosum]|uniref:Mads box protein n=1 Tax=Solanum tuberosum TaxID=4113 RepID=M1DV35_SOLTU|nr:PREDICTED: agamous-like MADS-box protein AGL62 [Solanum tuberosum]KAH0734369.1 hypothetical protein KY285_010076 [Solanum tuberosum]
MERKKTKGRQKIPMKKIENKDAMFATFTKRREGLYKKASELVTECDVDIGIMMISPAGKPHSFIHPIVDAVISRFQNPNMQLSESTNLEANVARDEVNQLKNKLKELDVAEDIAIAKSSSYDQMKETRQKGWWESIEQLSANEVFIFGTWLNETSSNMHHRLNQLEIEVSSSTRYESFGV